MEHVQDKVAIVTGAASGIGEQAKLALRHLAKGVAVVTTSWNGARLAMAATAVEGLSLEPPSMLVCVAKTASLASAMTTGSRFAINLLSVKQAHLVRRCSAPAISSWSA